MKHYNKEKKNKVNDFLLKACAKAMKAVPDVNASWMGSYIRNYDYVDINVRSSKFFRLINEIPFLILFFILILVIIKPEIN